MLMILPPFCQCALSFIAEHLDDEPAADSLRLFQAVGLSVGVVEERVTGLVRSQ